METQKYILQKYILQKHILQKQNEINLQKYILQKQNEINLQKQKQNEINLQKYMLRKQDKSLVPMKKEVKKKLTSIDILDETQNEQDYNKNLKLITQHDDRQIKNSRNIYFIVQNMKMGSSIMRAHQIKQQLLHYMDNIKIIDLQMLTNNILLEENNIFIWLGPIFNNFIDIIKKSKQNNNQHIMDIIDKYLYNKKKKLIDSALNNNIITDLIVNNVYMKDNFNITHKFKGNISVIYHHWDPRFEYCITETTDLVFGYMGSIKSLLHTQNFLHYDTLIKHYPILFYDTEIGEDVTHLVKQNKLNFPVNHTINNLPKIVHFNCDINIRPIGTAVSKFKTTAKIATSAILGHNIITTYDEAVKDILPKDYPFILHTDDYRSVENMFNLVIKDYNGNKELWYKGLEIMKEVKRKLDIKNIINQYCDLLNIKTDLSVAMYSANIGNYRAEINKGIDNMVFDKNIDYYFFTDNKSLKSRHWNITNIKLEPRLSFMDANRHTSKHIKFNVPKILHKYDIIIWRDSKNLFELKRLNIQKKKIIKLFNNNINDLFLFKHRSRLSSKQEILKTLQLNIEDRKNGVILYNKIKNIKFTTLLPDTECMIYSKNNIGILNKVYNEIIKNKIRRDQNIIQYAFYKHNYEDNISYFKYNVLYIVDMNKIKTNGRVYKSYDIIDFIDIGGSKGGSYKLIKKKYKYESGLAIDIDIRKVNNAIENNVPAIRLDATNMNIFNDNACKLISIIHTLEHLPNKTIIKDVLKESIRIARDIIYISGPMYYQTYLSELGFQFYWSHWRGHTCLIEPHTIIDIMKDFGQTNYKLNFKEKHKVENSSNTCIHSINGLIDRHHYDKTIDPPKKNNVPFKKDLYKEFELIFTLQ